MAERNKLPWFPIDPVQMITEKRFSDMDAATFGQAMRDAFYLWIYGQFPGDGSAESEKRRSVVQPWIEGVRKAQDRRMKTLSEKNRANAMIRVNRELGATGKPPLATAMRSLPSGSHREVEGDVEVEVKTTTTTTPALPLGFAEFWKAYPAKVSKAAAVKWWKKNKPDSGLQGRMLKALEWQSKQEAWTKERGAYIPHPASWLNAGRWDDEPLTVQSDAKGKPLPDYLTRNLAAPRPGDRASIPGRGNELVGAASRQPRHGENGGDREAGTPVRPDPSSDLEGDAGRS